MSGISGFAFDEIPRGGVLLSENFSEIILLCFIGFLVDSSES